MKLGRIVKPAASTDTDFVALGENSLDTVTRVVSLSSLRPKQRGGVVDLPGGQAATAAVACARLGWRTRYVGVVGDDEAGQVIRARLAAEGVGGTILVRGGAPTRRAVILVDDATGERVVIESRDSALDLAAGEVPDEVFTRTRLLLVDGSDPAQSVRAARAARAAGVPTLLDLDCVPPNTAELLALIDVIVLPESVVPAIGGHGGLGRALAAIGRESGATAVVATLGPAGALAWCRGSEVRSDAHVVEVVDSTGAGDAFRAGFAAAWLGSGQEDPDLGSLLDAANLVGALNCRSIGAQTALPTPADVPRALWGRV